MHLRRQTPTMDALPPLTEWTTPGGTHGGAYYPAACHISVA